MVRILVDGDACPVKEQIAQLQQHYAFDWWIFLDVSHVLDMDHAHIVYCDKGKDSADLVLLREAKKGDLVITSDIGLAGLALSKKCDVLDFNGHIIGEEAIEAMLLERSIYQKMRRQGKYGPRQKARSQKTNQQFYEACQKYLEEVYEREGN